MLEGFSQPYALEEDVEVAPQYHDHVSGEAFNEWYRPNRMDRRVNLRAYGRPDGVPSLVAGFSDELIANVVVGGSGAARGRGAGPARTILSLLQPALAAGVRALQQSLGPPAGAEAAGYASPVVAAALDGMDAPAWLFDESGRFVHQTKAATRLNLRLADRDVLRAAAEQFGRALLRARRSGTPVDASWTLDVGGERLRLTGTYLQPRAAWAPAVLVRADGAAARLPSEEALRGRYGLTRQEARVALLRARGVGTAAIAERLGVSVHTARRHTERAMGKLAVHRAAEIGPRLLALERDAP
jgi:DNA-binding CsgD family transcriptional regulator